MNAIPKIQSFSCPCCGGFIGEAAPISEVISAFRPNSRKTILKTLAGHLGRFVPKEEISRDLYAFAGPESAASAINVYICHLRKDIAPYGWSIVSSGRTGGPGSEGAQYRLIPSGVGQ